MILPCRATWRVCGRWTRSGARAAVSERQSVARAHCVVDRGCVCGCWHGDGVCCVSAGVVVGACAGHHAPAQGRSVSVMLAPATNSPAAHPGELASKGVGALPEPVWLSDRAKHSGGVTSSDHKENRRSGSGSVKQALAVVQLVQPVAQPSPGFFQAKAEPDCTVRSLQTHQPSGTRSISACTVTQ